MKNGLYIVSTPIGNVKDITFHALEVLKNADIILCEDTRRTDFLLKQHEITGKKLLILNEHSNNTEINRFLNLAKEGAVALVSDAGTPLVCDPGYEIVNKARECGIQTTVVLGACALIASATLCGINLNNTLFLGFFRKGITFDERYTNAVYVATHDVLPLIKNLHDFEEKHTVNIIIAREVTKEFEESLFFDDTAKALEHFTENQPRGEFTVFIKFEPKVMDVGKPVQEILNTLDGWQMLPKKSLSKFLHNYFLKNIPAKEIYEALNNS
jgi:16S rRNA (cytidine1402-2'-O)-methyltransferase